jgi:hypothetical protein
LLFILILYDFYRLCKGGMISTCKNKCFKIQGLSFITFGVSKVTMKLKILVLYFILYYKIIDILCMVLTTKQVILLYVLLCDNRNKFLLYLLRQLKIHETVTLFCDKINELLTLAFDN